MPLVIDKQTLLKYDVPGPRYTSYPTAPQWTNEVGERDLVPRLAAFGRNSKTLSLYVHIPFCRQLCYFCACNKVIRPYEDKNGDEYIDHLALEIGRVAAAIGTRKQVRQLHWGGGTPTYISEDQIRRLFHVITEAFDVDKNGEIAIEIDPRTVTPAKISTLRSLGFNRVSMGVQDFDRRVQEDINRIQPLEQVREVHRLCREAGFSSVNYDLIYGLPYQTRDTFSTTVDEVIRLRPDRIALYSFAYVPWISKPQNTFNLDAVPVHDEKLDIFLRSREQLTGAGYDAIAMDHFALASDEMARAFRDGTLNRNFMGYSLRPADEFIGVGVSAIGFLEDAFTQNIKTLPEYYAAVQQGRLPVERGKLLSADDLRRQWVINRLMCSFRVDKSEFAGRFGVRFDDYFAAEQGHLARCEKDGLMNQSEGLIQATDLGRLFIRNICMGFDAYLKAGSGPRQFSRTV